MQTHSLPLNNTGAIRTAVLLSLGSNLAIAIQCAVQQLAGASVSASMLIAFNATILLGFITAAAIWRGHWDYFKTAYPKQQFVRCLLRVLANATGMWAMLHLPLTTYLVIGFMAPLAVAMLSPLILHEPLVRRALVSVALGLAGMFIILHIDSIPTWPSVLALVSVLIGSLNGILVRTMPRDHPFTFMLFTNLFLALVFWPLAIPDIAKLTPAIIVQLGWVGLFSAFSSYAYFRANLLASPQHTAPLQYTQLVWGAGLGWLLYAHLPQPLFWLGATLIIAGSAWLLPKKAREMAPEVPSAAPPQTPVA